MEMDTDTPVPMQAQISAADRDANDGDANSNQSLEDQQPQYLAVAPGVQLTSRLGTRYQATVPDFAGVQRYDDEDAKMRPNVAGRPVWLAGQLDSAVVEEYLRNVYNLFVQGDDNFRDLFSEERALFFLHQMKYDVAAAGKLLYPIPVDVERKKAEDAEAEGGDGDDFCLKCGDGGNLMLCDYPGCQKAYHAGCVGLSAIPEEDYICARHFCAIGAERISPGPYVCAHCTTAYCEDHVPPPLKDRIHQVSDSMHGVVEFLCTLCLKKAIDRWGTGAQRTLNEKHFLDRLKVVLRQHGAPDHIPVIDGRELRLFDMYMSVAAAGGIAVVLEHNRWDEVRKAMRLPQSTSSSLLREHYLTCLYPYEQRYLEGSKPIPDQHRRGRGAGAGAVSTGGSATAGGTNTGR